MLMCSLGTTFAQITSPKSSSIVIISSSSNYIKRPYHNPNLIKQLEAEKTRQIEMQNAQIQSQKNLQEEQIAKICQNFYNARQVGRFTYGGSNKVSPRTINPRQVLPFTDFEEACKNYYKNAKLVKSAY